MEKNKLFLKRFLFIFQDLCVCHLQNMTLGNLDAIIYQGTKSFGFKNTSPKILLIIRPILTGKVCKPAISWKLLDRFEGVDWLWTNRISSVETKFCDTYSFQLSSCQMIPLNRSKCIFFDKKSFREGKLILLSRDPTNLPCMGLHRSHGRFYHMSPCWHNHYQLWQILTETVQCRDETRVAEKLIFTSRILQSFPSSELPQVISTRAGNENYRTLAIQPSWLLFSSR